jgi:uncharacterized membrane protein YdjX (TVP38/TMEM64 family)
MQPCASNLTRKQVTSPLNKHDSVWDDPQLLKKKRIIGILSIAGVLVLFVVLTFLLRKPLMDAIKDKASFRDWMQETGFWKYPLMVGIMALQVIVAFIPGEPIEILAGYIFGAWGGLLLCLLGSALGSMLIILTVRKLGMKFVTLFVEREQFENLKFFQNPKKRDITIFIVFLIPGTPKDILTYLSGLVPMHMGKFILITSVARIPSIITSTIGGSMLGHQKYKIAILVFAVTAILTLGAMLAYKGWQKRQEKPEKARPITPQTLSNESQQAPDQQISAPSPKDQPSMLLKVSHVKAETQVAPPYEGPSQQAQQEKKEADNVQTQ